MKLKNKKEEEEEEENSFKSTNSKIMNLEIKQLSSCTPLLCHINNLKNLKISGTSPSVCCVCLENIDLINNRIILCSSCKMLVHQECYGSELITLSSSITDWKCHKCLIIGKSKSINCIICKNSLPGAMKCINSENEWAHIVCLKWIPEITFFEERLKEGVDLSRIPEWRSGFICSICDEIDGCKIICEFGICPTKFHPSCAVNANIIKKTRDMLKLQPNNTKNHKCPVYCSSHYSTVINMEHNKRPQLIPYKQGKKTCCHEQKNKVKEIVRLDINKFLDLKANIDKQNSKEKINICTRCGENVEIMNSKFKIIEKKRLKELKKKKKECSVHIRDLVNPKIFVSKNKLNEICRPIGLSNINYSKNLDKICQCVEVLLEYINVRFETIEIKDRIKNRIVFTTQK